MPKSVLARPPTNGVVHDVALLAVPPPPTFNPTIPSPPVMLPQAGDWGQVGIVYSLGKVRSLTYFAADLTADLTAEQDQMQAQLAVIRALPDEDRAKRAQLRAWETAWAHNYRAYCLRLIGFYVLAVRPWPFAGAPPDPADPASWDAWPTAVLDWMTDDETALAQAREGLDGFLAPIPSSPPASSAPPLP